MSNVISSEIVGKQALISIRNIRYLVGRCVYRLTDAILHPKSSKNPFEKFKKTHNPKTKKDSNGSLNDPILNSNNENRVSPNGSNDPVK